MKGSRTSIWEILGVLIGLAALIVATLNFLVPFNPIGPSPFDSDGGEPTVGPTMVPASPVTTDAPAPTAEPAIVPSAEPVTAAISQAGDIRTVSRGGVEVEQVFVPAGSFMMGSEDGIDDERPVHEVTLDAFWIDRTEVTNAQFSACVADGVCQPPPEISSYTREDYYSNSEFSDYPVIHVSWFDAGDFCDWANGSLPSEAEWEFAARGPENLTYPWGEAQPTCSLLNYGFCIGDTSEVGALYDGRSWVDALDLAGNVWEWVEDWYSESYYEFSPIGNPTGPENGDYRVMRGASWGYNDPFWIRSSYRNILNYPHFRGFGVGFRCAQE